MVEDVIKKYNIEPDLIQSGTKNELFKFFITSDGITEINREINKVNNIDLDNDNIINLVLNNNITPITIKVIMLK